MMSEEATSQPILGTSQPAAASTGDGAMSTQPQATMSSQLLDNPPAYRAKEQEAGQTQPPLTSGAIPPVQYVIAAPVQSAVAKPNVPAPHDFLLFIVVAVIICGILNFLSLIIGFLAIAIAAFAHDLKISQKNYPKASKYSTIALALVIANIFCTLFGTFMIVALFTGLSFRGGLYGKCTNLRFYDNGQGYIYNCN